MNSDQAWENYGRLDPYYGVLTDAKFRKENLTSERLAEFFGTGESHVANLLENVRDHVGSFPAGCALDFGCGVGRLLLPFARRFQRVVGVDISPSMLTAAA